MSFGHSFLVLAEITLASVARLARAFSRASSRCLLAIVARLTGTPRHRAESCFSRAAVRSRGHPRAVRPRVELSFSCCMGQRPCQLIENALRGKWRPSVPTIVSICHGRTARGCRACFTACRQLTSSSLQKSRTIILCTYAVNAREHAVGSSFH